MARHGAMFAQVTVILYDTGMTLSAEHHIGFVMLPNTMIGIRDTRFPGGPVLSFTPSQWQAFVEDIRSGGGGMPARSQGQEIARHPRRFPQSY